MAEKAQSYARLALETSMLSISGSGQEARVTSDATGVLAT
jgi:hypothetical protein